MSQANSSITNKFIRTILRAGLIAGLLDALAAMGMFMVRGGKNPAVVWKYVASSVFGKEALTRGTGMVIWGLVFHFLIALIWASFFFVIYPALRRFIVTPAISGLLYGIFVWVVMNLVVLPLSYVTPQTFELSKVLIGSGIIMVCVGLPISLVVSKYYLGR
ncbi:DUF1440 domain-containing protein [Spirosoma validum]|uniref:DUF1440 domain-containing protein n=1 Tax=Spirosoma validum TaxID=2771355 RepID=A0A927GH32_9BACT|nr:DUF1440 domain-containing protein [Spirosoma validum]MBD2757597.1 DUF1440 domain-containing protein [Spirosoma validum]